MLPVSATASMSSSADISARLQALDTTASFCVQAPAGSGKTELLTQRVLRLLATCESPEEILAFTFTRKAAGEMRERLMGSLHLAADKDVELESLSKHKRTTYEMARAVLEQDQHKQWQLLANPHRLRITTIDSFNHGLTAQLPLRASMGAAANITTDMVPIFSSAIRSLFTRLETAGSLANNLTSILRHLHNDLGRAETMLQLLLEKREQWLPLVMQLRHQGQAPHDLLDESLSVIVSEQLARIEAVLSEELGEILRLVRYTAEHLTDVTDHPNHALAAHGIPGAELDELPYWRTLVDFLLTGDHAGFRKQGGLNSKLGFPGKSAVKDPDLKQEYEQAKQDFAALTQVLEARGMLAFLQDAAMLPDPAISSTLAPVLSALLDVLPVLATELDFAMREAGMVDFTQTTLAALQALGAEDDPTELALKLDYRLRHILVDEFQDTSSVQFKLLELLTRGWQPGDGRTLFVVGDGMQSCYGFRNARVSLFMQARERGIGDVPLIPLDLSVNFRSDAAVVSCVNAVFSAAFPQIPDVARGGVTYSPSRPRDPVATTAGVHLTLWTFEQAEPHKAARQQAEAQAIAARIKALQAEDPQQSIAILVRYRSHLKAIVPVLRSHGLGFNANEIDPLLSYPEISDLFVLLRAVLNPADSPAWFALLRTPMVGIEMNDVRLLAETCNAQPCTLWTVWQNPSLVPHLSKYAIQRLQRTGPVLHSARRLHQQWSTRLWLETLWLNLGGPDCVSSATVLPNVDSFLSLLEQYDGPAGFNLDGFALALEKAHGSVTDNSVKLVIQTIHKAKGLEYDAVIIPGVHRGGGQSDSPLLQWNEYIDENNQTHPVFALASPKGESQDPLYNYLSSEAAIRERYETTRLLYIGITRAVRSTWLYGEIKLDSKGFSATKNTLLASISAMVHKPPPELQLNLQALSDPVVDAFDAGLTPLKTQALRRLPADWSPPSSVNAFPVPAEPVEVEPQDQQLLARKRGELVHLGLKMLAEQGRDWLDIAHKLSIFRTRLAPLCPDQASLEAAVADVLGHLHTCSRGADADWLLFQPHKDAACELPLVDYRSGYRRDYSVDRTFVNTADVRWIIDYKSSSPAPDQTLQTFLQAETLRYLAQLETYAGLFAHEQRSVRVALFFTALPLLHSITLPYRMDNKGADGYAAQRPLFGPDDI